MNDNRKIKGILSVILFLILIAITISINAVYFNSYIITGNGHKAIENGCTYYDEVYCMEQGAPLRGKINYSETQWYDAVDPQFIDIIKMASGPRGDKGDWGEKNIKQHLIWWYIQTNGTDAINIINIAKSVGYPVYSDWSVDLVDGNNLRGDFQNAINGLSQSSASASSVSINIDSITPNGDYYKLKVSGIFDSYDIYINNVFYTTTSNLEIDIPVKSMGEATTAIIRVDAKKNIKTGKYKIYYTSTKQKKGGAKRRCQTLIRLKKRRKRNKCKCK